MTRGVRGGKEVAGKPFIGVKEWDRKKRRRPSDKKRGHYHPPDTKWCKMDDTRPRVGERRSASHATIEGRRGETSVNGWKIQVVKNAPPELWENQQPKESREEWGGRNYLHLSGQRRKQKEY